jgi:phage gpG-like protein
VLSIEIKTQIAEVRARLQKQLEIMRNLTTPLARITAQMFRGVMKNFIEEGTGRKKWEPLAESTLYAKAHRKRKRTTNPRILQDTGYLRMSAYPETTENEAVVSTNVAYGKYHQRGTKTIPKRPFMIIRDDARDNIINIARNWVFKGE